jgi:thiamine biosynthesis protein ThiS
MKLVINDDSREVPSTVQTVADLLGWLQIKPDRVAVELNRVISARGQWAQTQLSEGDQLEIVQFVGGGYF